MGCLNINIHRLQLSPIIKFSLINKNIDTKTEYLNSNLHVNSFDAGNHLSINIGIICSIDGTKIIKFEKDILSWRENENVVGVTKYNLLTSSENWILEEIEELL